TRWTENSRLLPFGLRGDAADLPVLVGLDARALASFAEACADRDLAEERRLAYVAATRAAFWLGCSGYWWGEATGPPWPSGVFTEVRAAGRGRGQPAARRGRRGGLAGDPGRPALRRGRRGGGPGGRGPPRHGGRRRRSARGGGRPGGRGR